MSRNRILSTLVLLSALVGSPMAQAGEMLSTACPNTSWNKYNRDFLAVNNNADSRVMQCVHRGAHDGHFDAGGGVPENSAEAIKLGLQAAPCVEVDVANMDVGGRAGATGKAVLFHDAKIWRGTSYFIDQNGVGRSQGTLVSKTASGKNMLYPGTVPNQNQSDLLNNPTIENVRFMYLRALAEENVNYDTAPKFNHPIVTVADLITYMANCGKASNWAYSPGVVILDVRNQRALENVKQEVLAVMGDRDKSRALWHFVVKVKIWNVVDSNPGSGWVYVQNSLTDLAAQGLSIQLTLLQKDAFKGDLMTVRAGKSAAQAISETCRFINADSGGSGRPRCSVEVSAPKGAGDQLFLSNTVPVIDCWGELGTAVLGTLNNLITNHTTCAAKGFPAAVQIAGWVQAVEFCGAFQAINKVDNPETCLYRTGRKNAGVTSYATGTCCKLLDPIERMENKKGYVTDMEWARMITFDAGIKYIVDENKYNINQYSFCNTPQTTRCSY